MFANHARLGFGIRGTSVLLAFLVAGCGGEKEAGGAGGFQMPPTPVETAAVVTGEVVDRFEAVGSVEAAEAITVVSEVPGVVSQLPFREGEPVNKGAVLAQLDNREPAATLARAEAIQAQKQSAYNRIKLVVDQGAGTPQDLDDAAAELKIAEADVELARARLAKTKIQAPFAGRVGERRVSPGAFIQPGTPITDLAKITTIKVTFTAPERYFPSLMVGAQVEISTTAYPGEILLGSIDVIDPVLNTETRSVDVIATAENPGERFRPGMSANVSAVLSRRENALTIPAEAVFAEGDQTLVYLVQGDSTVARTPVTLGLRLPATVEVLSGLESGQLVVRAGHQKLYPGARIMPVSSQPPAASAEAPHEAQ